MHDDLPASQKSKVPFDKVRSFYVDGKAVLIKGRVTDDVAIEEILHPFVDSLYVDNNELFANLLKEARKNFPELTQEIEDAYTDRRGFSKKHRELELVTQALTRHFGKEFAENESKPFKDAVKEFLTWFMDIIKNLSEYLTGKVFSARSISSKATMTDIARLLNTSDIQFKIEKVADRKVRYNLTDGAKVAYDAAIGASNPLQKEIVENIFHAAVHSSKNVGSLAASRNQIKLVKDGLQPVYKSLISSVSPNMLGEYLSTIPTVQNAFASIDDVKMKAAFGMSFKDLKLDFIRNYTLHPKTARLLARRREQ